MLYTLPQPPPPQPTNQPRKQKTTSVHLSLKTLFFLYNRMCFCPVPDSQSLPCNWISLWGNGSVPQSLCCRCFLLLKATAPLSSLPTKTVLHFCQMVRTHDVTQSNFWLLIALGWLFLSLSVTSPDTSYLLELSSLACHCRGWISMACCWASLGLSHLRKGVRLTCVKCFQCLLPTCVQFFPPADICLFSYSSPDLLALLF